MRKRAGVVTACFMSLLLVGFLQASAKDVITFGYSIALTGVHSAGAPGAD